MLKQSVSSAIGILFVYAATIVFFSLGDVFRSFVAPLPMVHLSGTKMNLFSFSGADYTIICTQVLSMIILAFLANLVDAVLPKGERILSWLFFRCLSVVLAIAGNLVIHWLFTSYLPEGLVTYAPTILLSKHLRPFDNTTSDMNQGNNETWRANSTLLRLMPMFGSNFS